MSKAVQVPVKSLSLDLSNYRTVRQRDENHAIQAMIAMKPDRFWALTESLIDDGYLATENILVLKRGKAKKLEMIVKEGNRRVAALKLIHGILPVKNFTAPDNIKQKIRDIPAVWKKSNQKIPCTVYENKDEAKVDHIVTLAHGKGEKAGRDQWNAVARARHNRDFGQGSEPALDILEKYLKNGKNVTALEKEIWSGDYPLTVFHEAIKRLASRFNVADAPALAKKYPAIPNRDALERILNDIGNKILAFDTIRDKTEDFGTLYGIPPAVNVAGVGGTPVPPPAPPAGGTGTGNPTLPGQPVSTTPGGQTQPGTLPNPTGKTIAVAINDPKSVTQALKKFIVLGNGRDKVESLRKEAISINIKKNPMAFCFLLRSMFEISSKAYCDDFAAASGPKYLKADGTERRLVEVLKDIYSHLINLAGAGQDTIIKKVLHGAMVELGKPEGILSVTSMNQLVHNPTFSITSGDISSMFGNVFPLLFAMNR